MNALREAKAYLAGQVWSDKWADLHPNDPAVLLAALVDEIEAAPAGNLNGQRVRVVAVGVSEAVDEYKRRADAYFQTAERQGIRAERLAEALEVLLDRCDDSDGAQYGTLATTFVRDICSAALTCDPENKP